MVIGVYQDQLELIIFPIIEIIAIIMVMNIVIM